MTNIGNGWGVEWRLQVRWRLGMVGFGRPGQGVVGKGGRKDSKAGWDSGLVG